MKISLLPNFFRAGEIIYSNSFIKNVSDFKKELGSYVHQELFRQYKNVPKEINLDLIDISGYLEQFNVFKSNNNITILDVETPIQIESWPIYFYGNIDILVAQRDKLGLIEIKTGSEREEYRYQVAAYVQGLREMGFNINFATLLYLRENDYGSLTFKKLNELVLETKELIKNNKSELLIYENKPGY